MLSQSFHCSDSYPDLHAAGHMGTFTYWPGDRGFKACKDGMTWQSMNSEQECFCASPGLSSSPSLSGVETYPKVNFFSLGSDRSSFLLNFQLCFYNSTGKVKCIYYLNVVCSGRNIIFKQLLNNYSFNLKWPIISKALGRCFNPKCFKWSEQ